MKKLDFFNYAAILAAGILLFAACSNDKDDGNGEKIVGGGKIEIPNEPPAVSGGQLTKTGGVAVTTNNLEDFIDVYVSAIKRNSNPYPSGVRALPEEYEKGSFSENSFYTRIGNNFGYVERTQKEEGIYDESAANETYIWYESNTFKFFDFSNTGVLFLGGALGVLESEEETVGNSTETIKANGRINFAGKYAGSVVFDNVVSVNDVITSGSFYVQSNGSGRIPLPDSYLYDFYYPSSDNTSYPAGEITVNKMPIIPAVPNGTLSSHSGNNTTVNAGNVNDFFRAAVAENGEYGYAPSRAANEYRETEEGLNHGRVSGYQTWKGDWLTQENNNGDYFQETETYKFDDYSNKGLLYLGGGYAEAGFGNYNSNSNGSSETRQTIISGRVRFNGEFSGELVFDNFRYRYEYQSGMNWFERYTYVSGSVKIGNLDVSQKYLDYVIERKFIPGNGGNLVNASGQAWMSSNGGIYREGYVFRANGTYDRVQEFLPGYCRVEYSGTYQTNGSALTLNNNSPVNYNVMGDILTWDNGYDERGSSFTKANINMSGNFTPPSNTIALANGQWREGNITGSSNGSQTYSFSVSAGTTYYVWWNDRFSGDGGKTLDIRVYAWQNEIIFEGDDMGRDNPRSFTANSSGTVYLIVAPLSSGNTGTYSIVYNTTGNRP